MNEEKSQEERQIKEAISNREDLKAYLGNLIWAEYDGHILTLSRSMEDDANFVILNPNNINCLIDFLKDSLLIKKLHNQEKNNEKRTQDEIR